MVGIVLVWFSALMFVYLGLGDAINGMLHIRFVLFRCVKCATFWSVLGYSLFVGLSIEASLAIAFLLSYVSLWVELVLNKLSDKYDEYYQDLGSEDEEESDE